MRLARRIVVIWAIDTLALWSLTFVIPGLELEGWIWAIWAVATIGLLNALVRPFLLVVMLPFTVLSLGFLSIVLNAGMVVLADQVLPGFHVATFVAALWLVLGLAAINTVATGLLSINDDESFYRNVVLRLTRRMDTTGRSDQPGLAVIEIDGLSTRALQRAIDEGYLPTLQRWLDEGRFRLTSWDCGLPSQTSSSQAGILYGHNFGIPAFRWYEKPERQLMVSSRPGTATEIHRRVSRGTGLLAPDGLSLTNIVSGDARESVMTLSTLIGGARTVGRGGSYFLYFLNPYTFTRTLVLMVWEVLREFGQRLRARFQRPRQPHTRGGSFVLLRAVSNVFLRDFNIYLLIERMLGGTPVIYCTFPGYDVVAHHVGPLTRDALVTLKHLDDGLASLERASYRAPRPYRFLLLSDHGQSPGATFAQRYGVTIEELIAGALEDRESVTGASADDEAWANLNALLSEAIQDESLAGRTARRVLDRRIRDGYVDLGPGTGELDDPSSQIVVCNSGNLSLVYFTDVEGRMSLEDMLIRFPHLISSIARHPGIGFVMVRSEAHGLMLIGREGINYLDRGVVDGVDPLAPFAPESAAHLKRVDSFPNIGDLVINSFYDPETGEVAAFEDQVGSHGGLGGDQTCPFLLYPADMAVPDRIAGPEGIFRILRSYVSTVPVHPPDGTRTPNTPDYVSSGRDAR